MIIEKFKENFNEELESDDIIIIIFIIIIVLFWIATVMHSIKLSKVKNIKNTQAGIVLSALSWPFYWVFYLTGTINYTTKKRKFYQQTK